MAPEEFVTDLCTQLLIDRFPKDAWCLACDGVLDRGGGHAQTRIRKHSGTHNRFGISVRVHAPTLSSISQDSGSQDQSKPMQLKGGLADVYFPLRKQGIAAAIHLDITSPRCKPL